LNATTTPDPAGNQGVTNSADNGGSINVSGQQGGANATMTQTVHNEGAAASAAAETELSAAIRTLQEQLAELLVAHPGLLQQEDVDDANTALTQAAAEAARPEPRSGVLRRRLNNIKDALTQATALGTSVAGLEAVFRTVFG
jgi:F0F1-type ATP synthase membrane subunit b/b'